MTMSYPRCFLTVLFLLLSAGLLRAQTISSIESLGDNTYTVTASATNKFTRNTAKLKAAGIDAATQFCAKEGKQFKLVSAAESKSMYLVGDMAATKITFKALTAGDPELGATNGTLANSAPAPTATDSLYDELIKLDDLRKKGILTDEEFAAEKKKVLSRSK
jgi:hypothetical protein